MTHITSCRQLLRARRMLAVTRKLRRWISQTDAKMRAYEQRQSELLAKLAHYEQAQTEAQSNLAGQVQYEVGRVAGGLTKLL